MATAPRLGLYVHIPFCPQRCPYCAFTVITGQQDRVDRYVSAVCMELEQWSHLRERGGVDTVFLGGGTPSRLAPDQVARLLDTADRVLGLKGSAEITLEANPTTADADRFTAFRQAGCNRLSLGAQSLCDDDLRRLGRMHTAAEAEDAYMTAREVGFASVSFDLIFSIPGGDPANWAQTLARAIELAPDHLSAYALSVEPGTAFERRRLAGDLPDVGEDVDAGAYELLVQRLVDSGYEHYEISNFSRAGHRSRHNWDCWTGADYIGVGLSAHSYLEGRRFWNGTDLDGYLQLVEGGTSAQAGEEMLEAGAARGEILWLGLRTCQGVRLLPAEMDSLQASGLALELERKGKVIVHENTLRLTESGFAIADAVAVALTDVVCA